MEMDASSDHSMSCKKGKVKCQVVSIPVDLVMDILMRLSARDVLRSRTVCKEWNLLLRTPKFISLHYNHSLHMSHENAPDSSSFIYLRPVPPRPLFGTFPPEPRSMYGSPPKSSTLTFLTLEKTCNGIVAKVDKEEDFIAMLLSLLFPYCPTESDIENLQMTCPFDGLICFGCGKHVILYNPATRESRILPSYPKLSYIYGFHILGVWFESTVEHQFKVFRIFRSDDSCKIHIYDSTLDSWRVSETLDGEASYDSSLLLNGVFYFCMTKSSGHVIVTFDAKLETFGYLEMPQSFVDRWHMSLFPFRGNLACMDKYIDMKDEFLEFDLWVMTEDEIQQSWNHKFCVSFDFPGFGTFEDDYCPGSPIAFWNEQDELLFETLGHTVSFNLNTEKRTNLKLAYIPFHEVAIIPYNVESLLSLK